MTQPPSPPLTTLGASPLTRTVPHTPCITARWIEPAEVLAYAAHTHGVSGDLVVAYQPSHASTTLKAGFKRRVPVCELGEAMQQHFESHSTPVVIDDSVKA